MTAWANFQGPFTLHGVAAAALGIPAAKLRLLTPSESGGSFGTKAAVLHAVVLMAIASRLLGVPVRWTEDRNEHLLAASMATERTSEVEAAFSADGRLLGLRLDLIDEVGAYVRAPEPATLYRMHGCLTGAYDVQDLAVRSRVVVSNRAPSGLNRGFGGPQLYSALERTMHIAARRLGIDPGRARAPQPRAGPADALPRRGRRRLRLRRLPGLPRPRAGAGGLRPSCAPSRQRRAPRGACSASGSPAWSSRASPTWATSRSWRRAEQRAAGLPKSGNAEGVDDRDGRAGRRHAAHHDDAAGTGPPHRRGAGGGRRPRPRPGADRRPHRRRHGRQPVDGLIRQLLEPLRGDGRVRGASRGDAARRSPARPRRTRAWLRARGRGARGTGGRARVRGDERAQRPAAPARRSRALAPQRPHRRRPPRGSR